MSNACFPVLLTAPLVPGAVPCFIVREADQPRRRPIWDARCSTILTRCAARHSNVEVAGFIAAETGMHFKEKTISEHRAALGLESPRRNAWTAPLRRWRPWVTDGTQ
jgi:hypothetical protein